MHDAKFAEVANRRNKLLVESACFLFFEFGFWSNITEELTVAAVLHYDVEAEWSLNNLVHLNDMGVAHYFKNVDLASHTLNIVDLCDFVLFKNFDCHFLPCKKVNALFDFAKGALTKSFCHSVATNYLLTQYFGVYVHIIGR